MTSYGTPMGPPGTADLKATVEPAATICFVLALSSVVIWIVPAVVALFLAPGAKRNIEASKGLRRGAQLALAAQVVSFTSIALVCVIALSVIVNEI